MKESTKIALIAALVLIGLGAAIKYFGGDADAPGEPEQNSSRFVPFDGGAVPVAFTLAASDLEKRRAVIPEGAILYNVVEVYCYQGRIMMLSLDVNTPPFPHMGGPCQMDKPYRPPDSDHKA